MSKKCNRCQVEKSIDEYTIQRNNSDSVSHICLLCEIKVKKMSNSINLNK